MLNDFKSWQKVCAFLTRRCQLRCRGCNVVNFQSAYEMNLEEWKRAIDILKYYKIGFFVGFGGEPTLRNDLPQIIEYLNKVNLPHTIITNSIRMLSDSSYYDKILNSRPFGISCSVNSLEEVMSWDDEKKTSAGIGLLKKLEKDYDGDLVANIAVTAKNLNDLPKIVKHFSGRNIWSILSFFHVSPKNLSSYYWYRGPISDDNRSLVLTEKDAQKLKEIGNYFIENYDNLLLHNSRKYFEIWRTDLPIKQNWHCHSWACPAINSDGRLMACIDRPLTKPFTIFDLPGKESEIIENFYETIEGCSCGWDHMLETNWYAEENLVEEGKEIFKHKRRGNI